MRPWHDVLEVAPDADAATVKAAFRRKALAHHPDRDPAGFAAVNAAYGEWLSTQPASRAPEAPPPSAADLDRIFRALPLRRRSRTWLLWLLAAAIVVTAALLVRLR
ncbi:MAG TPA: J domain-containing protein [Polyangia bacterium]|nr:J domain-containing protein [Polyangia bacterium]